VPEFQRPSSIDILRCEKGIGSGRQVNEHVGKFGSDPGVVGAVDGKGR
jgi:hypothetical protein